MLKMSKPFGRIIHDCLLVGFPGRPGPASIAHAGPAGVFSDPLYECQITIKAPETIDVHAVNMGV